MNSFKQFLNTTQCSLNLLSPSKLAPYWAKKGLRPRHFKYRLKATPVEVTGETTVFQSVNTNQPFTNWLWLPAIAVYCLSFEMKGIIYWDPMWLLCIQHSQNSTLKHAQE